MPCRSNNRGFTLIEILVAIVLFTFGALLAARMQTWGMRSTTFGKQALAATTASQALMEQLKEAAVQNNFNLVIANGGPAPVRPDNTPGNIQALTGGQGLRPWPDMTIQWTVNNPVTGVNTTTGATPNRYTTVTVTVLWEGNTRNYTTQTIISETQ